MNRKNIGRLIVFEGPDGVGKSTLAKATYEHLRGIGRPCELMSFPGRKPGTLGELVYRLHHQSSRLGVASLTAASKQALHIAAHIDAIQSVILPTLAKGSDIVLDRYWWSTFVYGLADGVNRTLLKALVAAEEVVWQETRPIVLFNITRSGPLRAEDPILWRCWAEEYSRIALEQSAHVPVVTVSNDGPFETALSTVLGLLERPTSTNEAATKRVLHAGPWRPTPTVFTKLSPAKPTQVYDTYWRFAAERQEIFFRRIRGVRPPLTDDPILLEHKFTNAYRASDRVSQYLIRHVIYDGAQVPEEVFFRTLLFKVFNRIETWELLKKRLGAICLADFSVERYERVMDIAMASGEKLYSAAYIMPSAGRVFGCTRKHGGHLRLIKQMLDEGVPRKAATARAMRHVFELLRSYPSIGDFLAYQYATDINYSDMTAFSEMEFVVPGPGARDGLRKCFSDFGGLTEADLIRVVADRQESEFQRLDLTFKTLWGRPLQLIDCQNLFCEVDKYARVAHPEVAGLTGRTRIKQKYRTNLEPIAYWYPPKWGLNERIATEVAHDSAHPG